MYVPLYAGEIFTAEKARTRFIEVVLDWTDLSSLGTFQNGFTANPAKPPKLRVQRVMGGLEWLLDGRLNNSGPANLVNATVTMFTFTSTDYRPTVEEGDTQYGASSGHYGVRVGLMTNGNLTASVPAAAASPTTVWLTGFTIRNPK